MQFTGNSRVGVLLIFLEGWQMLLYSRKKAAVSPPHIYSQTAVKPTTCLARGARPKGCKEQLTQWEVNSSVSPSQLPLELWLNSSCLDGGDETKRRRPRETRCHDGFQRGTCLFVAPQIRTNFCTSKILPGKLFLQWETSLLLYAFISVFGRHQGNDQRS